MDHVDDNDEKFILGLLRVPSLMFAISSGRLLHLFKVVDKKIALHDDIGFLRTFILSLGNWSNRHEDLHLLSPTLSIAQIEDFKKFRDCLEDSISEIFQAWDPDCNGVIKMLDNVMVWKKQVTEIYPVLLNLRSVSLSYVSHPVLNCLISSILQNGEKILVSIPDLDAFEKKVIKAVVVRLKFLKTVVHLTEIESMRSVLTIIQEYARKAAYVLFLCWTGEIPANKRYEFLSDLQHRSINGSTKIILDILRVSKKMLIGKGITVGYIDNRDGVKLQTNNLIWEDTAERITLLDDHHNFQLLNCNSRLIVHLNSLHQYLRYSSTFLDYLSIDMKAMIVQAATCHGFVDVFQLVDQSEEVGKFDTSVLVTVLVLLEAELLLLQLMKQKSRLIIVMTDRLKELENNLRFLRKFVIASKFSEGCTERNILLLSHCEAAAFGVLSLCQTLDEHKMEEDLSEEMVLSFLKVFGFTDFVLIEIYVLYWLRSNVMAAQMKYQYESLYIKLKFMLEFLENLDDFAENQIPFLLDTVLMASQLTSCLKKLTFDEVNEMRKQTLIATFELLEAELMLHTLLTDQDDIITCFDKIKMLRNGLKHLRIMSLDSIKPYTEDEKSLRSKGEALARTAVALINNLFRNKRNEGMATELNHLISDLIEKINSFKTDVRSYYLNVWKSSQPTLPKINKLGFLVFLVEKLSTLLSHTPIFSPIRYQFERILNDLKFTTSLLKDLSREYNEDDELNNLVSSLTDIGYEVENVAELFIIGDNSTKYILCIYVLVDMVNQLRIRITDMLANMSNYTPLTFTKEREKNDTLSTNNKVIVGMVKEVEKIINDLTRGTKKRGIVSIVGMGGLGKTTLAQRVYNDSLVRVSFNVSAWCCVSKLYHKRKLLLDILGFLTEQTDEMKRLTDDDLSHKLWKLLLGRSYFIVMDDIWDIRAWEDVKKALPNEENGSRILFTSRDNNVGVRAMSSFVPCSLNLLSKKESLELLEKTVFNGEVFPIKFREVGQEIALHCRGLPLAIVVISGVLTTEMNLDWWNQVARNLKSIVLKDLNFTNIIDLSFRYLPDYLKPCFLYFGAFQEDETVYVSNLIRLWSAEGLIRTNSDKSSIDVTKDYIMELVNRNLLIVAERTSMDGIKACRVHDLLHELCRAKANETNFLQVVNYVDESSSDSCPNRVLEYQCRRLCIYSKRDKLIESEPSGQHVRSFLYFALRDKPNSPYKEYYPSFISSNFKLLSTLSIDCINIGDYLPYGIETLIHLRFLSVRGTMKKIPDLIANLCFLETFLVKGSRGEILLPCNVWSMKTLTHLHVKDRVSFSFSEEILDHLSQLDNLETLSSVFLPHENSYRNNILQRLPRLKKLKCIFSEYWDDVKQCNEFPVLESMKRLESLKVLYHGRVRHPSVFSYPTTLKKLTLSKFRLPWKDISVIGRLRCLEVLKLLFKAFEGEEWEVGSEEFLNLKYLKMDSLDIVRWIASYDSFPCLEHIVLQNCKQLVEVPFDFGESSTLQTIQVKHCSNSVVKSVRDIEDEQLETLVRKLNVFVHPPDSYIPPF